jgi:hypothetical protein
MTRQCFESHKSYVVVGLAIYKPCVILAARVNGDLSIQEGINGGKFSDGISGYANE